MELNLNLNCAWTGLVNLFIQVNLRNHYCWSLYARISIREGGLSGSVAKDKAKAHEYWLPSVEITRRHDRMVGSAWLSE